MKNRYHVCRLEDLQIRSTKSFVIESTSQKLEGFVVCMSKNEIYAYENRCPHTGVQLNWQPNQFLDMDNWFIQCGVHGALFQSHDGLCIRGPCLGQQLRAMKLIIDAGVIWCEIP